MSTPPPGPPASSNKLLGIVLGSLLGVFALCGFCFILGTVNNKIFRNVASATEPEGIKTPRITAEAFVAHVSAGQEARAWQLLSAAKQADLTVPEFSRQIAAWPPKADRVGLTSVDDGPATIERKSFTATATDKKGTTHWLEMEVVSEFGEWKIDSFKLK